MNVKYKLYLPIVKPFVFGGPEYNVRISKSPKYLGHKLDTEASEWYMNLGVGVELFSKVQVALSWNWGLNDTFKDYNSKPRVIKLGGTIFF